MSMYEKTQAEYNDVMAKKKIVEADKAKIQEAIAQLDMKKNDALNKAYIKVRFDWLLYRSTPCFFALSMFLIVE